MTFIFCCCCWCEKHIVLYNCCFIANSSLPYLYSWLSSHTTHTHLLCMRRGRRNIHTHPYYYYYILSYALCIFYLFFPSYKRFDDLKKLSLSPSPSFSHVICFPRSADNNYPAGLHTHPHFLTSAVFNRSHPFILHLLHKQMLSSWQSRMKWYF